MEPDAIQWGMPEAAKSYLWRIGVRTLIACPILALIFTAFLHVATRRNPSSEALTMTALAVIILLMSLYMIQMYRRALKVTYSVDSRGVHMHPGFSVPWSEIRSFKVVDGGLGGTLFLKIESTRKPGATSIVFDPEVVEANQLLRFAEGRIGT